MNMKTFVAWKLSDLEDNFNRWIDLADKNGRKVVVTHTSTHLNGSQINFIVLYKYSYQNL